MDDQFKNTSVIGTAALLLGLSACVAVSGASAAETEQFSLKQQPTMLFDGGSETLTGSVNGVPYEIIQGYAIAQGDMVLGRLFADGRLEIPGQARGLGQLGALERWPDGIIPYQFSNESTQIQRDRALAAIAHWNDRTSIRLIARTEENAAEFKDYVSFEPSNGCASWVGRTGGEQAVWLADSCTVGSIIHEIGHAIGLFHEHTRPDRDDFVTVNWGNVSSSKELNFEKIEVGAANFSSYDYGSIMHYGEYFFSNNGERSITAPDGVSIGQRDALSDKDASSVDLMYATDLKLDVSTTAAEGSERVDVLVSNIGALGANSLMLTARLSDDADWLSISADSGWNCEQYGAVLRCTRDTLAERKDSSFSILVDPNSSSIDALKVRVQSDTLDTELNNNVFNDDIQAVAPEQTTQPSGTPTSTQEPSSSNPSTDTGGTTQPENTAQPENTSLATNTSGTPSLGAASSGSGGGGATGYLLLLLLAGRLFTRVSKKLR